MKLLKSIHVQQFRSIHDERLDDLGELTAIAGLNNSGKSNFLRALHAFFTDEVGPDDALDVDRDFYRPELAKKKKKSISVAVEFELPQAFKFRKGLEGAEKLLGRSFSILKRWERDYRDPFFYLNGESKPLSSTDIELVDRFFDLIHFRYIPNRVLPTELIRREHEALRDALVRRLAKKTAPDREALFADIEKTSANLVEQMASRFQQLCPGIDGLRLRTPKSWAEILFALGYQVRHGAVEVEDDLQGSGIQSLLMLETLSLIDRDYFQQFGWRQAAIWAIEEPESSLHSSLEAEVAAHLSSISRERGGRLQVLATTHSDFIVRHADAARLVDRQNGATTIRASDIREVLRQASKHGISRWTHPLLYFPTDPLLIVEGKYDRDVMKQAMHLLHPTLELRVVCLEDLEPANSKGGEDTLVKYLKDNREVVRSRGPDAIVVALFDWESTKAEAVRAAFVPTDPIVALTWERSEANPRMASTFKGIERFLPDRVVAAADDVGHIGTTKTGKLVIAHDNYGAFKKACNYIVNQGLKRDDLRYIERCAERIARAASGVALSALIEQAPTPRAGPRRSPPSRGASKDVATVASRTAATGQAGPKVDLLMPNEKELLVARVLATEGELNLEALARAAFPTLDPSRANSWVRNSLRRLVRADWAVALGGGRYRTGPANSAKPTSSSARRRPS